MLVAVTSCRSDGYYNQKAPGSTSKLPRKAPTNLKLFHELAVGVKDAYAAVGATPRKPSDEDQKQLSEEEYNGRMVLWDFIGNLDFVSGCFRFAKAVRTQELTLFVCSLPYSSLHSLMRSPWTRLLVGPLKTIKRSRGCATLSRSATVSWRRCW
jgi:hypothetical protein